MATALERPMLLEGEAGVGKTAIANALSSALDRPLFRLQCHESLDLNQAVYEWNYSKQLLEIRLREAEKGVGESLRQDLFSEAFLLKRPLMQAITTDKPAVLLIDEVTMVNLIEVNDATVLSLTTTLYPAPKRGFVWTS